MSDGTCTYIVTANGDYREYFNGEYDAQDFGHMVEQIDKQGFFELATMFPTSPATDITSLEVVTNDGRRLVTTYNWTNTSLAFARCNFY